MSVTYAGLKSLPFQDEEILAEGYERVRRISPKMEFPLYTIGGTHLALGDIPIIRGTQV
ncbi:hypothetical protein HYW76_01550 [Candidatus Pacearchaeota archaeon]|nr:hypothetical protein [Candidatus Pacearchaeota archaeon]